MIYISYWYVNCVSDFVYLFTILPPTTLEWLGEWICLKKFICIEQFWKATKPNSSYLWAVELGVYGWKTNY